MQRVFLFAPEPGFPLSIASFTISVSWTASFCHE